MNVFLSRLLALTNKLAPWALLVCVLCLTWYLAAIIWFVVAPPKAQNLSPVDLPANQQANQIDGTMFDVFAKPKVQVQAPTAVNSDFELKGVFVSTVAERSSAVISSSSGTVKRYHYGAEIETSGYRLVEVNWGSALLEDASGSSIELTLSKDFELNQRDSFSGGSGGTSASSEAFNPDNMQNMSNPSPSYDFDTSNTESKSQREQLDDAVDDAINQLRSNPAGYLSRMGVMATGDGYEVTTAMNSQIRANIGLQPGDKVISVNGQSIGQPQQDAILLEEIKRSGSAEIQVQRGSQVITIRQQF